MYRIELDRPDDFFQFEIQNGNLRKSFTWWCFHPAWEQWQQLARLGLRRGQIPIDQVLRLFGSHATLWIGDLKGTIAPMDVEPQGWTYPNGEPLEPEWWWQWHPCPESNSKIKDFLNRSDIFAASTLPLKLGLPFQAQRRMGQTLAIDAISIQQLPGMVNKEAAWIFERSLR